MSDVFSTGLQGLRQAFDKLDLASRNISRISIPSRPPQDRETFPDSGSPALDATPADFARQLVYVLEARIEARANLKVVETRSALDSDLLDILA